MTAEQVKQFLEFLETKNMCVAGATFQRLLGCHELRPLDSRDIDRMIADFIATQKA